MRLFAAKSIVLFVAVFAIALMPVSAFAQQVALTTERIEKIRQNCLAAQVTLQRIQYSDVAIRINRGQAYDAILSKYIAPFNSRATLNRLSEVTILTERTSAIEKAVSKFRKSYVEYEDALSDTLGIKCQDRPVAFYDSLNRTRELRTKLEKNTQNVQKALAEYSAIIKEIEESLGGMAQ